MPLQEEAEAKAEQFRWEWIPFTYITQTALVVYMPFATHVEYEAALGVGISEEDNYKEDLRDKLRQRLEELFQQQFNIITVSNNLIKKYVDF